MGDLLVIARNAADGPSQDVDADFYPVIELSGTAPALRSVPVRLLPPPSAMVSDSGVADYVSKTLTRIYMPQYSELGADGKKLFHSLSDAEFLTQIRKDLDELPEAVRSSSEAALCRRFVEGVGMALASVPGARCAVFGDEEDGVELVAHSRASMRQVTFEFRPDQNSINIVSIDEDMRRFERSCGVDKVQTLAEAIAWLNPR